MERNKLSIMAMIAVILGAAGLGVGAYSVFTVQTGGADGEYGDDGDDGTIGQKGEDAPGDIVVGILDPDDGEIISGNITIRAMIAGSEDYDVKVYINGSLNATYVSFTWNTSKVANGWWNVTVIATDVATNDVSQDEVIVYVLNLDDPTNIYYCSSRTEVGDALNAIGASSGTIMITQSIALWGTININGGGSYVIQGVGSCTVDCNGNRRAFYITSATACTIRDLKIDASDITSASQPLIEIDEGSNNPIHIENVQIIGDTDRRGYGVYIQSNNTWISDCYFYQLNYGIRTTSAGGWAHIYGNTISDVYYVGIWSEGSYNVFESNYFQITQLSCFGIYQLGGSHGTVANNIIVIRGYDGIRIEGGDYNTITGNHITGATKNEALGRSGIYIGGDADYNIVVGNGCFDFQNIHITGVGYGIRIETSDCDQNTIVGNTALNNEVNFFDAGINTFGNATLNNFA